MRMGLGIRHFKDLTDEQLSAAHEWARLYLPPLTIEVELADEGGNYDILCHVAPILTLSWGPHGCTSVKVKRKGVFVPVPPPALVAL